jgi:hypothetical protein
VLDERAVISQKPILGKKSTDIRRCTKFVSWFQVPQKSSIRDQEENAQLISLIHIDVDHDRIYGSTRCTSSRVDTVTVSVFKCFGCARRVERGMEMEGVYLHQPTCWNRRLSQVRLVKICARQRRTVQGSSGCRWRQSFPSLLRPSLDRIRVFGGGTDWRRTS